jgi:hypothetical protein
MGSKEFVLMVAVAAWRIADTQNRKYAGTHVSRGRNKSIRFLVRADSWDRVIPQNPRRSSDRPTVTFKANSFTGEKL